MFLCLSIVGCAKTQDAETAVVADEEVPVKEAKEFGLDEQYVLVYSVSSSGEEIPVAGFFAWDEDEAVARVEKLPSGSYNMYAENGFSMSIDTYRESMLGKNHFYRDDLEFGMEMPMLIDGVHEIFISESPMYAGDLIDVWDDMIYADYLLEYPEGEWYVEFRNWEDETLDVCYFTTIADESFESSIDEYGNPIMDVTGCRMVTAKVDEEKVHIDLPGYDMVKVVGRKSTEYRNLKDGYLNLKWFSPGRYTLYGVSEEKPLCATNEIRFILEE